MWGNSGEGRGTTEEGGFGEGEVRGVGKPWAEANGMPGGWPRRPLPRPFREHLSPIIVLTIKSLVPALYTKILENPTKIQSQVWNSRKPHKNVYF